MKAAPEEVVASLLKQGGCLNLRVKEHNLQAGTDFPTQERIPSEGTIVPDVVDAKSLEV
jgi:hypothetical protein